MSRSKKENAVVLIVDDKPENLDVLIDTLEHLAFDSLVAQNGTTVFNILENVKPDIILLDVMMPGMDGFEVCRRLKTKDETKDIPVIFMTALTDTVDKVKGFELGAVDYITKPFQHDEVLARLKSHLTIRYLQKKLEDANNTLETRVVKRTAALAEANRKLKIEIDERLKMEKALRMVQKVEALGTLSGGIAHDFNNILSVIIGNAEMIELFGNPEDHLGIQFQLKNILGAAYRAKSLVQQILTFTRRTEQEKISMRLTPIVQETIEFLTSSLPSNIEIRTTIEKETGTVIADPTRMHQVVMNLCTNAYHAMKEKGGVLEVVLAEMDIDQKTLNEHPDLVPGPYTLLSVSDTGCGMDREIMERIFDPYFTTKNPGEGTGLGLAVSHGIVADQGGCITIDSLPGKGSTFRVFLPQEQTAFTVSES